MPKTHPEQLPPQAEKPGSFVYRMATIDRSGIDRENRSLPLILATDAPVDVYDWTQGRVIKEVLHTDGITKGAQVPMLDSHDRSTVRNVLGSMRELKAGGGELRARAFFGSDPASTKAFNDYADGHLTDFSVGVSVRSDNIEYDGNTRHVRRSRLLEGSAVVVGADPNAKATLALRAYTDPEQVRSEVMYEKLRELLVQRGMKSEASDAEVLDFAQKQLERKDATPEQLKELGDVLRALKPQNAPQAQATSPQKPQVSESDIISRERERVSGIEELLRTHTGRFTAEDRTKWLKEGASVDTVARAILDKIKPDSQPTAGGGSVTFGASEREKFYAAATDAIVQRCISGQSMSASKMIDSAKARGDYGVVERCQEVQRSFEKPAAGYDQFRYRSLSDIARMFLERAGENVDGLPRAEIARRAMRQREFCEIRRDGGGYNTIGTFSNLMLDAANKTLRMAYDEAPATYQRWVRIAPSAPDLKTLNRIAFGALPSPEDIPENGRYPETTTSDSKESYAVTKKGQMWSASWEAVVNDDMDAFSRGPAMHGAAMKRRVNYDCYTIGLTSNAPLSDGVTLFDSTRANGANNTLTVANLNTAFGAMAIQTALGQSSGTPPAYLNLVPKFLFVPRALEGTAWQITHSFADPAAGGSAAGNSNSENMYGPRGERQLEVIADAVLDGASTSVWYLGCPTNLIDTVELTFLQGEEAPFLDREVGFDTDSIRSKIRQTYGVKTIDYRGLYRGGTAPS